jgi:hypothetical protein
MPSRAAVRTVLNAVGAGADAIAVCLPLADGTGMSTVPPPRSPAAAMARLSAGAASAEPSATAP